MKCKTIFFENDKTQFYFDTNFDKIDAILTSNNVIIITDSNVALAHKTKLKNYATIVFKAGEASKNQLTINTIIAKLIQLKADRNTILLGVGGGVVTDITGFVASIFLRGVSFGFVPTSLLAMVDASVGGKNGIDVGVYKNIVGTINQPKFIVYDTNFLDTLPLKEWQNGFAEIIKHACIGNTKMFAQLQQKNIDFYRNNNKKLKNLIKKNVLFKAKIVANDTYETSTRKLLNFGHTFGHAIENTCNISHGNAVSIGICFAAKLSAQLLSFNDYKIIETLLQQYNLPTTISYTATKVFNAVTKDKKRENKVINFILISQIGKAIVQPIDISFLKKTIQSHQQL
jgi:3-dehydroquinate synthase